MTARGEPASPSRLSISGSNPLGNHEWHEVHEVRRGGHRCAGSVAWAVGGGGDPAVPMIREDSWTQWAACARETGGFARGAILRCPGNWRFCAWSNLEVPGKLAVLRAVQS